MQSSNRFHVSSHDLRVLVIPASIRTGSLNQALAGELSERVAEVGHHVEIVDLSHYSMPLYNGDLEAQEGPPASAVALAERIAAADVVILVSPEYNGSFSPLLKNTVDWLTRIDTQILAGAGVMLASASPGAGGGRNGLDMVKAWLSNMNVAVAERCYAVGSAALDEEGRITGTAKSVVLDRFAEQIDPRAAAA